MIVSLWNRTAASVRTVENTPQAPSHGSVLSSYFIPNTSRPLTNISTHSLRELTSPSTSPMMSSAILCSSDSLMNSARLESNSSPSSPSSPGSISISMPSMPMRTPSGFSISISISGAALNSSSMPRGAAYKLLSMLIIILSSTPRVCLI